MYFKKGIPMADEQKTDKTPVTPTATGGDSTVTMTQEKLDGLINGKFAKGAESATNKLLEDLGIENIDGLKEIIKAKKESDDANRSDLEKAQNTINELNATLETSTNTMKQMKESNDITALALKHGVSDVDYFKYAYGQVKGVEDFNAESFIKTMKESKPYVFGKETGIPKTDNSGNGGTPNDLASTVKGKTFQELQKMQQNL